MILNPSPSGRLIKENGPSSFGGSFCAETTTDKKINRTLSLLIDRLIGYHTI